MMLVETMSLQAPVIAQFQCLNSSLSLGTQVNSLCSHQNSKAEW